MVRKCRNASWEGVPAVLGPQQPSPWNFTPWWASVRPEPLPTASCCSAHSASSLPGCQPTCLSAAPTLRPPCRAVAFLAAFFQFLSGHCLSCFLVEILVRLGLVTFPWIEAGTQFTGCFSHLRSCRSPCILLQTLFPLASPVPALCALAEPSERLCCFFKVLCVLPSLSNLISHIKQSSQHRH